jgi:hypothetical protein
MDMAMPQTERSTRRCSCSSGSILPVGRRDVGLLTDRLIGGGSRSHTS